MRLLVLFALLFVALPPSAFARDQLRVVGSGTVFPFTTAAAEQFGQQGKFASPIVESTGTGGGFKLFCAGAGVDTPDINDASRKMTESEMALCRQNGVTDIVPIAIGYDGIVIASSKALPPLALTKKNLFLALAREVPDKNGKPVRNPYMNWKEIDPVLPDRAILLYGPSTVSGTRDTFVELVMEPGCAQTGIKNHDACRLMREDGRYVEMGEDYNITIQKLQGAEYALGIMGYNFYDANTANVQANPVESVLPSEAAIEAGKYAISRPLYIYVKAQHIGMVPGLVEFVREMTSVDAIGPTGYNTAYGLLPLNDADRRASQAAAAKLAGQPK